MKKTHNQKLGGTVASGAFAKVLMELREHPSCVVRLPCVDLAELFETPRQRKTRGN